MLYSDISDHFVIKEPKLSKFKRGRSILQNSKNRDSKTAII
jgi:hypothetical protein